MTQIITRPLILQAMRAALEPLDYVHAMWEGGAAAFGRVDEWSDIDLQIDVDDAHVAGAAATAERALADLAPIELRYELPQPTWHGCTQVFYRLTGASEYLIVDFVVIPHSHSNKFLEPEIHGQAVVHFDKTGVVTAPPLDRAALLTQLEARAASIRGSYELFRPFALKELQRGNRLEALGFYQALTLRPLVEALRLRHCPTRYSFHTRYVYYDLPPEIVRRLEPLFFVASPEALWARHAEATAWLAQVVAELTPAVLAQAVAAAGGDHKS